MDALGSLLFLVLCTAIPTIMAGVLLYRIVRWAIVRGGWRNTLRENGWTSEVGRDDVAAALEDVGLTTKRADLSWLAGRDGAFVAYYRLRGRTQGTGRSRRVLAVPRRSDGPSGTLQPRVGGLLERAAVSVAKAFSSEAKDFDGWEWALVFPRRERWLDPAQSPALRDFLRPAEMLAFGPKWVLLALPDGEMPELLARLEGLERIAAEAPDAHAAPPDGSDTDPDPAPTVASSER